ncbi:MAG: HD domain-containing protein [Kofleriaceae bacterium]
MTSTSEVGARIRALAEADPVVLVEIGAAIANGEGGWPDDSVTSAAQELAPTLHAAPRDRVKMAVEELLMGREVDSALEWLMQSGLLMVLFPELVDTVNLVQEPGRQHKDVWAHTKQVVKQTVRRPLVRWAALLHDIGKVPTRTYTSNGVHFHGHAWVGAKMFDKIAQRLPFARDERQTIRFLVNHHLRTNQYSEQWTDSAVRRFHREMGPHLRDLLDLSRADITSKRPGRRKSLLEQISALADRAERLAEEDAKLPPLPSGVGNAIMSAFELPPSRLIGDLKRVLEAAIDSGELEARREDAYYVAHLARRGIVPEVPAEVTARLIAEGGLDEEQAAAARAAEEAGDFAGPHAGVEPDDHDGDPERPRPGVLACGHDPHNDPCVHRDVDPDDPDRFDLGV